MSIDKLRPLVSIDCITYNHEAYISQALDGFLMQKTKFPFEVLIHDDLSTDGTADIIRKYEKKHPLIIKPIYQTVNQFSKGVEISKKFQFPRAQGKYIAICEGDDYWTNPNKLQKQVDILEANPEIGLVHSDFDKLFEKRGKIIRSFNRNNRIANSTNSNVFNGLLKRQYKVATLTILARKELITKALNSFDKTGYMMTDLPMWLEMTQMTKFHYIKESLGVYRKVRGSVSNDNYTYRSFIESGLRIRLDYAKKYSAPNEIKNKLQADHLKSILLKAFYTNDLKLRAHYLISMKDNNVSIGLWDRIICYSMKNRLLYGILLGFDKIKNTIILTLKFIVRKNL
jgi:glycosyltransferase involved in cell wall biosynthesis